MSRPDGPEPSSASPENAIAVSAAPTAPPKGASGRLSRSGYAILGVSGLVVATAFAAVAELAGPGSVTDTATNTTSGGGPGGLQGSSQVVLPGNAVPGGPMTVPGSPTPGQTAPPTPTTVVAVGPDGKPTTSVITPPPNAGQPAGQPGGQPGGGQPVPGGTTSQRSDPPPPTKSSGGTTTPPSTPVTTPPETSTPTNPPSSDSSAPKPPTGSSSTGGQPSSTSSASTSDTNPTSSTSR